MTKIVNPVIGVIGGTGDLGSGLAKGWSAAGYQVIIGSRSRDRAVAFAETLGNRVTGDDNAATARAADVIVLAVPFASHEATINEIKPGAQGKILVDAVVPLVPPRISTAQLPPAGSAAQLAQALLGQNVCVVSAFHNISAAKLHAGSLVDADVLVFSDDKAARDLVVELAQKVAIRGIAGGRLANSAAAEALTSVLIWINRNYKVDGAGVVITGLNPVGPM